MAAKGGHAEILKYLLSKPEQLVSVNERNQNILDIAIEARQEAVALAIVEHKRWKEIYFQTVPLKTDFIERPASACELYTWFPKLTLLRLKPHLSCY